MERVQIRVNAPQVIHESIAGEVIIINLSTGNYFSLTGAGADVWEVIHLSPGISTSKLVDALSDRFAATGSVLGESVSAFVEQLKEEGLVAEAKEDVDVEAQTAPGWSLAEGSRLPFEPPRIEKYTDMQDLVLLDPVHEVEAVGWPQARPADASVSATGA
jgi:Coenzyme PQQ synthesis protein D (PqqD)